MGAPFKMKGHTLPGPNQKSSPAKIAPAIVAALIGLGTTLIGGMSKSANTKKVVEAKKLEQESEGREQFANIDFGSKKDTNIT
tara:strand:+ start:63 stop:311 length:249 start_codon:yes stop_codon:yes gene_type:complete